MQQHCFISNVLRVLRQDFYLFQAGLFIDKGVKTTVASAADPREYLCLDNSARCVCVCLFVCFTICHSIYVVIVVISVPLQFLLKLAVA